MIVQVVLGFVVYKCQTRMYDCAAVLGFVHKCQRLDCMTVQVVLGLCCLQMSETRLYD